MQHPADLGVRNDPARVVDVVPDPRRQQVEPRHRADDLAVVVDLHVVDQRVVLEHHRQARIRAEQRPADVGTGARQTTHGDADRRLAGHADLDVGRAVAREHGHEPEQEQVTELLGHPLAADQPMDLVIRPGEAPAVALVEEMLEERRVTRDQEAVRRAKDRQGREDLVEVGPDRLDDAVAHHPETHVEPGRPRPHRERVDRDEGRRAEGVSREERDVAMGELALAPPADPVVGHPGGAARLVDRRAGEGDAPAVAAVHQGVAVDIGLLVRLGEAAKDPQREETRCIDTGIREKRRIGRHTAGRAPCRSFGTESADDPEQRGGRHREQGQEPAVAQPDGPEHRVERKQPDPASHADEGRHRVVCEPIQPGRHGAPFTLTDLSSR